MSMIHHNLSYTLVVLLGLVSLALALETGTPHARVVDLTDDTFQTALQDASNSLWLLKFYAPWCGHCKRLAPVLEEVAPLVAGKMAIGRINCDVEKQLCNNFEIRGFPTLKVARDGQVFDYPGKRDKDDIVKFAKRMSLPAIQPCDSYESALEQVSDDGIVFCGYAPDVSSEEPLRKQLESSHTTRVLHQVARIHQANANFCLLQKTDDVGREFGHSNAKVPFLAKLEVGDVPPTLYTTTSEEDWTSPKLLDFVQQHNVPLVVEFGPHNFHKLGRNGRPLVIGAVDASSESQVQEMQQNLRAYALTGEYASKYYFGWIDGVQWKKFLGQFGVDTLPQVFILNVPDKTYWQNTTYEGVEALIRAAERGEMEPRTAGRKTTGIQGALYKFESWFLRWAPWSLIPIVVTMVMLLLWILPKDNELRPPYKKTTTSSKRTATTTKPAESKESEPAEESKTTEDHEETKKDK